VEYAIGELLGYGGLAQTTVARLPEQFLDWVLHESVDRRAAVSGAAVTWPALFEQWKALSNGSILRPCL